MVVYYLNKVSERLADYRYPIKEGDICMLYDGDAVKTIYVDSETEADSIWRDFKFIDSKSLKSYHLPKTDSVLCAPVGNKHAIGNTGLLTLLIKECKGEWLLDFLNETSAVLSGYVDYWDLMVLRRLTGDDNICKSYEDENILYDLIDTKEEDKDKAFYNDAVDEEDDDVEDEALPINDSIKNFCLAALASLEEHFDKRNYQIVYETLNGAKQSSVASKNNLTRERVRQIVVKTTSNAKKLFESQQKEFKEIKAENTRLNAQINLLKEQVEGLKAQLPKNIFIQDNANVQIDAEVAELLETPVREINLPVRAINILLTLEVDKFADIAKIANAMQLLKVRNSGRKTLSDITQFLNDFQLTFGMSLGDIINVLKTTDWQAAKNKWIKQGRKENKENLPNYNLMNPNKKKADIIPEMEFSKENRKGMPWTMEEEELITLYFQMEKSPAIIAEMVGRTEVSILSRLGKLGLIDYTYGQDKSVDKDDSQNKEK